MLYRRWFASLILIGTSFFCACQSQDETSIEGQRQTREAAQSNEDASTNDQSNALYPIEELDGVAEGNTVHLTWAPIDSARAYHIIWSRSESVDDGGTEIVRQAQFTHENLVADTYLYSIFAVGDEGAGSRTEITVEVTAAGDTNDVALRLTSSAFQNNQPIPADYVQKNGGGNQSPPLSWANAPANTASFAIQMVDLDFRDPPFIHWIITDISGDTTQIPAGIPAGDNLAAPTEVMGANQPAGAYRGPNPPNLHRYEFTLYALPANVTLNLGDDSAANKQELENKSLAQAQIIGTYE
jgi:hypothetical protein